MAKSTSCQFSCTNSENVVVLTRQQLILTVFSLCLIMAFVMCLWAEKGRCLMFARSILINQIRRKGSKRSEHVGIQKGANFTIVSTKVLIGLNVKFYEIFAKQHVC